jgi:hypothetical protein
MARNPTNIKLLFIIFSSCLLMQHLFAQDSSSAGSAKITISFSEKDSSRQVAAKLINADTAVAGVDVHFYVKKSFGLLPLEGDNVTTDENGEATVDFPTDLPGDVSGNVIVIARVEDDEKLGNVEAMKTVNWGIPVKAEQPKPTRALWSSGDNAPWPLTITVTGVVIIVWGIIFYIFYQLVKIKKAGKYEIETGNK